MNLLRHIFAFLCFFSAIQSVLGQGFAINTTDATADPSAILDVTSSNKGILIPRVALISTTDVTTIPSPATSLMIYNTTTTGGLIPGFYYFNGTSWVLVGSGGASSGWALTGNTGTVTSTNFLGTTDNVSLTFKTNNQKAGYISNSLFSDANTFFGYTAGNVTTGTLNSAFGYESMLVNTTGQANAAFGTQTLKANTTGFNNVAVGHRALFSNTTGSSNVGLGFFALQTNTTGTDNIAIGEQALQGNNTGSYSIGIGREALFVNTASHIIGIGFQAVYANSTGFGNVGIGSETLRANSTGSNNIAIGYQTLFSNTAGNNTAIGHQALNANTSGLQNNALGYFAMKSNTTGFQNAAVGAYALYLNTAGSSNAGVGDGAVYNNTTGNNNTGMGRSALYGNQTGSNNAVLGTNSLINGNNHNQVTALGANIDISTNRTNVTAVGYGILDADVTDNSVRIGNGAVTKTDIAGQLRVNANAIGTNDFAFPTIRGTAGQVLTTDGTGSTSWAAAAGSGWGLTGNAGTTAGTNFIGTTDAQDLVFKVNGFLAGIITNANGNLFLGLHAGNLTTTGSQNVFLGRLAGNANTTGFSNTYLGDLAGTSNADGSQNTSVGWNSGKDNVSGSQNVFLGYQAGALNTASFNTFLGADAGKLNVSGLNNVFLGYRAGYNETGSDKLYIANSLTTTPLIWGDFATSALQINGSLRINTGSNTIDFPVIRGTSGQVLTTDGVGGTSWAAAGGSGWGLTGNAGTVAGTNFIGTTDAQSLVFKVNNQQAGRIEAVGTLNTFYGFGAAIATTGNNNIVTGYQAFPNNVGGSKNVVIGNSAGNFYSNLNNSVLIGHEVVLVAASATASNNVILGGAAAWNGAGSDNVLIGSQSTNPVNKGTGNIMIGKDAGNAESGSNKLYIANSNTASPLIWGDFSTSALQINGSLRINTSTNTIDFPTTRGTSGQVLTTNGAGGTSWAAAAGSGWGLTGNAGTIAGTNFLGTNDDIPFEFKVNNIRAGYISNSAGTSTSFGYNSLPDASTGVRNTAYGFEALRNNFTGQDNVAIGTNTLSNNTTGFSNVAIGFAALLQNTLGGSNVANGMNALRNNTTGSSNVANGLEALFANTSGIRNVANGMQALNVNTVGFDNTAIGYQANVSLNNLENATTIGSGAIVNASNKVRIGNASVTICEVPANWAIVSDKNLKTAIKADVVGLNFINKLNPVTYQYIAHGENAIRFTGLLAQDVDETLQKLGIQSSIVTKPNADGTGSWGIRYAVCSQNLS